MNAAKQVIWKPKVLEVPVRVEAPKEVAPKVVEKKKEVYQGMKSAETKLVGTSKLSQGTPVSGKK